MDGNERLRAVKLLTWRHSPESTVTGSIEWTPAGWLVTGDAGWLLTDYHAVLVTAARRRQVTSEEGLLFLYAIWFSMRATYFSVELVDAEGRAIQREELLADLDYLASR